ncbi:UPF0606 protein KIAA1549L [Acipenser ruthenus]|uniref:UPF0606 protein KIAA1549L n=1 Tax=Acipenser ruthenus TaxID=7906 RepID=A0A444U975_ACIRT|nr:UPF0606 protein KIAA1549L [Acipenser ruthenus]
MSVLDTQMAFNLRSAHNYFCIADFYAVDRAYGLWIDVSDTGCSFQKNWKTPALIGMITKCLMTIGMVLFLLQPVLATEVEYVPAVRTAVNPVVLNTAFMLAFTIPMLLAFLEGASHMLIQPEQAAIHGDSDQGNYETSAFAALSQDPVATVGPSHSLAMLLLAEEESMSAVKPEPSGLSESTTETLTSDSTAFQSILTLLTSLKTAMHKPTLVQSPTSLINPNNGSQTTRWPSEVSTEESASLTSKDATTVTSASTSSSGLTTSTMHSTLSQTHSVPYTASTIPSLSISTETSSISKEPASASSPSSSSLTTISLHLTQTSANTIPLTQSTVKPTEVPLTTETLASLGPGSGTTKLVTLSYSVYSTSNGITMPNETSQGTEENTHTAETIASTSSFVTTVQTMNKDVPVTHTTSVVPSVATEYILSSSSDYSAVGSAETSKPTTLTSTGSPAMMTSQNETNQTTNGVSTTDSRTTVLSVSPSVTAEYPTPAAVITMSPRTHVSSRITTTFITEGISSSLSSNSVSSATPATTVSQTTKEVTDNLSSQSTLLYSTKPTVSTSSPTSTSAGFITVDETSTVSDSQQTTSVSNSVTSSTVLTISVNGSLQSPTTVKDKTTSLTSAFPTMGSTVPSSTEDTTRGPLPTENGTSIVTEAQTTVLSFVTTYTSSGYLDFTSVRSSVEPTTTGSLTESNNWSSTLATTPQTELSSTVSSSVAANTTSGLLISPGTSSMEPTSEPYTATESANGSATLAITFSSSTTGRLTNSTSVEVSTTKDEVSAEVSTFQTYSTEPLLSSTITSAITDATAMVNSTSTPDITVSSTFTTLGTEDTSSESELTSTVSPVTTSQGLTTMITPTENQTTNTQPTSSLSVISSSTTASVGSTASMTTLEVNPDETTPDQTTIYLSSTASKINMTTVSASSSTESPTTVLTQFSSLIPPSESTETATSETTSTTERTTFMLSSPSASPEVSTFQTHFTEPPLSSSMTPSHTSPTETPSTVFSTANVTHSLITEEMTTGDIASTSRSTVSISLTTVATEGTSPESGIAPTVPSLTSTKVNTTTADTVETTSTQLTSTTHTTHITVTYVTPPYTPTSTLTTPTTAMASIPPISTTQLVTDTETVVTSEGTSVAPETMETSSSPSVTITAALTSMITMSSQTTRDTAFEVQSTTRPPSTTTVKPLECKITERIWVKTVLSLNLRRNRVDDAIKQNLRTGLTQALQNAFNNNAVHAQIESLTGTTNVTVGYYATNGRTVYITAVVIKALTDYGDLMSDMKQHVTNVQSLPIPVAPWIPTPALWMQLKTVLRFVGATDNIQSCSFVQTMAHRLQNAFTEAESKVLNANNNLTVQILSTSQSAESPAVTLIYVVWNQSVILNGTVSSSLLNQLTAELVGYYLFFPPLIIAEPLKYNNLDISPSTKDYWVTTVIQDVDNSSLNGNYQSFASLMEQRLAELLVIAQQQGRRFRRATTVGSYTVQMVDMKRVEGAKSRAALTYYILQNGTPLLGTSTAKILNTIDSQTMALTLGYFVQQQAEPVVKNPPNNLWIIAAVLAPIAVVTVIIIIITAVLCRKNKNDFKSDTMANMHQRAKIEAICNHSYLLQPVQGFDYAKQHLGQQGGEEETRPVTQETGVLPLPVRDAPLSQERGISQDGSTTKTTMTSEIRKSRLPSENCSVISNESGKPNTGRMSPQKMTTQQKLTKEESRKKNVPMSDEEDGAVLFDRVSRSSPDPYDTSSGSLQLIAIKPLVNKALKQKSDIEHYRNKVRLKAKRKGYYDFPALDGNSKSLPQKQRHVYEKAQLELGRALDPDEDMSSTYVKSKNRQSHMKSPAYRSRQSLNSPSPGGTEMDLLVTRERPRRGIRNSGYDPSIDEVRQQMHLLLEEAFSLASAGQATTNRQQGQYNPVQQLPFSEVVTSAPGTMNRPRGAVQWVPAYSSDLYQYSLPRPAFRFSQLPDMAMGSPPPPLPPRSGPAAVTSLQRSTSDIETKTRTSEPIGPEHQNQHDAAPFVPVTRASVSTASVDQPVSNYSGNPAPAVYAIPANRPGYSGYFIPTPPTPYRSQTWMPYPAEVNVPSQWAEAVPLPGYVEAYPHSCYQQNSQASSLDQAPTPSTTASQQSLTENDTSDASLTNISTAALVKAIREEVAKLAKKQTDMFEFQV